jgi:hypothetical protein
LAFDCLVLVLYSHSDIEVDKFQTNLPVNNKVFGLVVLVSDIELVKIRDDLDEARADDVDCVWNDSCNKITCSDFG